MSRKPINFDDYSVANKEGVVVDLTAEGGAILLGFFLKKKRIK